MRTVEEIEKEIDKIETQRFALEMKDKWTSEDKERDRQLYIKLMGLKEELKHVQHVHAE